MKLLFRPFPLLSKVLFIALLFLISCEKDDSPINVDDPIQTSGRFSNYISCSIIAPPLDVGLSSFYTKYLNCSGIPVIGTNGVPDEAFFIANETMEFLLTGLGEVHSQLINKGNYIVLVEKGLTIGDLPENWQWDGASTGAYRGNIGAFASDVASLLCSPEAGYGHTFVHEAAHMIHLSALNILNGNFDSDLEAAYNNAIGNGLWDNTYAKSNYREYLAEGVTIYYGVNWIGPVGGDGSRNEIGTRKQLQDYDPNFYNLIAANLNSLTDMPGCREPVIWGVTANCPETITDIDGNEYEIVNIGPMCWMKENLKTSRYNDGTPIAHIPDNTQWQNDTGGAWSNLDNDPANDAIYGKLYNGYALNNALNICPEGWHVPSIQELQDLVNYAGGDYTAFNLRATILWDPSNITATNTSGFSALAAGIRSMEGNFQEAGRRTNFGSLTTSDASKYYSKAIFGDQVYVYTDNSSKNVGTSCRCIKD